MNKAIIIALIFIVSMLYLPHISVVCEDKNFYWDYVLEYNFTYPVKLKKLVISQNGTYMAVFLNNNSLLIYRNKTVVHKYRYYGNILTAGFSPSCRYFYFFQDVSYKFVIINISKNITKVFEIPSKIFVVSFSKDEKYLAIGGRRKRIDDVNNKIYYIDLEQDKILWERKVVKDVYRIIFYDDYSIVALTMETFCGVCLSNKERNVRFFDKEGVEQLEMEKVKYLEDIIPTNKKSELILVHTSDRGISQNKISIYKLDFSKHSFEIVKEIDTVDYGRYYGLSPDMKYLYFVKESNGNIRVSIINPKQGLVYTKIIKLSVSSGDEFKMALARNFTILTYYRRIGDEIAKLAIYRPGRKAVNILLNASYDLFEYTENANKIFVYSLKKAQPILLYSYARRKIEEEKYFRLSITILDKYGNILKNSNLTIKELGESLPVSNGTWTLYLPQGVYTIIASKKDYREALKIVNLTADTSTEIILLPRVYLLKVYVSLPDGKPVNDTEVYLYSNKGMLVSSSKTNSTGFCLFEVKEGFYELAVLWDNEFIRENVNVSYDIRVNITVPFKKPEYTVVTVSVVGSNGEKLNNFTMYFFDFTSGILVARYSPSINETLRLPIGKYRVFVSAKGYKNKELILDLETSDILTVTLEKEEGLEKEKPFNVLILVVAALMAVALVVVSIFVKRRKSR